MDHLGRGRRVAEDAVAEAEVQRGADDDHHVRALEGRGSRTGDQARVARRKQPPTQPGEDRRQVELGDQVDGLLLGEARPHVAGEHDHGRPGGSQDLGGTVEGTGIRNLHGRRDGLLGRCCGPEVEEVHRHVEEHRSAVRGQREPERLGCARPDRRRVLQRPGGLRDRTEQRGVVELLQRAGAPARLRCATTDHDHRRTVEQPGRQRRHRVGHARSGSDCGEPGRPVQPAGGLGGEDGGRLVADVEQPYGSVALGGLPIGCGIEPLLASDRGVVQREDVRPREGEQGGGAVRLRSGDDVVPAVAGDLGLAHACDASTAPGGRACRGRPRRPLTARVRARLRSARRVPSRSLPGPALSAPPDRPAGTRSAGGWPRCGCWPRRAGSPRG